MKRLTYSRGGLAAALSFSVILATSAIGFLACSSDKTPIETSAGVRPAGEVKTIDAVADVLAQLRDIQNAAVKKHEALFGNELNDVHAKRRELLTATGTSLKASINLLARIKKGEVTSGPSAALVPLATVGRPFLDTAVALGIITRQVADTIASFLPPAPLPGTTWRRVKTAGGVYVVLVRSAPHGIVVAQILR